MQEYKSKQIEIAPPGSKLSQISVEKPSPGGFQFQGGDMDNVAILVDAEFFIKQFRLHVNKEAAPEEIAKELHDVCFRHLAPSKKAKGRPWDKLYRIIVYDCPPMLKKVRHPISGRDVDLSKTKTAKDRTAFHKNLIEKRKVALRKGYLDEDNAAWSIQPSILKDIFSKKRTFESLEEHEVNYLGRQKAVDMKIGLDIASLAYKKNVNKIVLIAGDSDFVPAAKLARREGIDFVLDPMWKTIKSDLLEHVDGIRTVITKNGKSRKQKSEKAQSSTSDNKDNGS